MPGLDGAVVDDGDPIGVLSGVWDPPVDKGYATATVVAEADPEAVIDWVERLL